MMKCETINLIQAIKSQRHIFGTLPFLKGGGGNGWEDSKISNPMTLLRVESRGGLNCYGYYLQDHVSLKN